MMTLISEWMRIHAISLSLKTRLLEGSWFELQAQRIFPVEGSMMGRLIGTGELAGVAIAWQIKEMASRPQYEKGSPVQGIAIECSKNDHDLKGICSNAWLELGQALSP